jgi:hypothetical protein
VPRKKQSAIERWEEAVSHATGYGCDPDVIAKIQADEQDRLNGGDEEDER